MTRTQERETEKMQKIKRSAYREGRGKSSGGLIVFMMLLLIVALAFGGAYLWQSYEDSRAERPSKSTSEPPESVSGPEESENPEQSEQSTSETQPSGFSSEESSEQQVSSAVAFGQAVPESARVNSDYFDDALFVGDSVTDGIQAYAIMKNTTVIAHTGINPETILTKEVIRTDSGDTITMPEAMAQHPEAKKIYIMLGANGIAWIGKDSFIEHYGEFIDLVKEQHPDAVIYIQSILPVTKTKQDGDDRYANSKIDDYNTAIRKLTKEKEVYYLDVAEAFKDEDGNLPEEASPVDGMHFGPKYYEKWFEYLKVHTVEP